MGCADDAGYGPVAIEQVLAIIEETGNFPVTLARGNHQGPVENLAAEVPRSHNI